MKRTPMNPGNSFKRPDAAERAIRPKTCKACRAKFTPARQMQIVCDAACGFIYGIAQRAKERQKAARADRASTRAALDAIKPRSHWLKQAQAAVNAYVRQRDAGLPCISCGKPDTGARDAGHFFTVGARPELRFDLDNIHAQCVQCNQHKHGNVAFYRIGLTAKIGEARVARLEGPHPALKLTTPDLQALRDEFRAKTRTLTTEKHE
jgi:hypothetical protein